MRRGVSWWGRISEMNHADSYAADYSGYMNEILYRMCSEQPDHAEPEVVASKIQLIGRSYAATLERGAGDGFSYDEFGREFVSRYGEELDSYLMDLRKTGRIEQSENQEKLLCTHQFLMNALGCLTRHDRRLEGATKRSLASKYLHFHSPLNVFIYDSVVVAQLAKEVRGASLPLADSSRHTVDSDYAKFVNQILYYRGIEEGRTSGIRLSPRRLDTELYIRGTRGANDSPKHRYWHDLSLTGIKVK
jgi:hypothetical protein